MSSPIVPTRRSASWETPLAHIFDDTGCAPGEAVLQSLRGPDMPARAAWRGWQPPNDEILKVLGELK